MKIFKKVFFLSVVFISFPLIAESKNMILFEDFENGYGKWQSEGTAFGKSPFPVEQFVDNNKLKNYEGEFVINSYNTRNNIGNADKHVGKLTSPEFTIQKKFISFFIAGGNSKDKLFVRLLIDGKAIASVTGYGSLEMEQEFFNTSKYIGRKAQLQIVDKHTSGWGFIAIDYISFSDSLGECDY